MDGLIQNTDQSSIGQLNNNGEEMDGTNETDTLPNDDTNITSAFMCPPVQKITHKVEQPDVDHEGSQGPEAIQIVKQQISQMLVSKYVKQDKNMSNDGEVNASETNPIQSVKQQISNFLLEKYADRQKSISPERNITGIDKSEKSIPETEIHTDTSTSENGINDTDIDTTDNLNNSANLIQGFCIPDFEADVVGQIAEMNKDNIDNEDVDDEFENKPIVSALDSVNENIAVPLELNDGNVAFQPLDENPFDENRVAQDQISEEETICEQDIKPEVHAEESETETPRTLSAPANKVTLDLNTISTLSNIWDKSYRNEKWPKKTKSHPSKAPTTRLDIQLNDTSGNVDENFEIVENSSLVTETESEEVNEAKGINNLQISESLKFKLMNLSSLQSPNEEADVNEEIQSEQTIAPEIEPSAELGATNHGAADTVEPEGIESLRLSESLKLKLLNIKNMKKLSKASTKPLKHKKTLGKKKSHGHGLITLKRKVGRPRKNSIPGNTTNEIPDPSILNIEKESQVKQIVNNGTYTLKRKVGRPKLQNSKHFGKTHTMSSFKRLKLKSKFKHTSLKSKSKSLSGATKKQPDQALTKKKTSKPSKTPKHTGLKRKVGRPPKSASVPKVTETDIDNESEQCYDSFNLKQCFIKLKTVESNLNAIQENGLKVDTTVPKKTKIKMGPKSMKKKIGRPKKSVQAVITCGSESKAKSPEVDDDIQALVESREDFITKNTAEVFTKPKSGMPEKNIAGKTKTSVKVSLKSKTRVKCKSKAKQQGPKRTVNTENLKQVSQDLFQINENTNGDLTREITEHVSENNSTETVQQTEELIPENENKDEPTDDWEDDWQSDGIEGDSSDDYFPSDQSDEEYKPKNKKSYMKTPSIKVKSEHSNDKNAEDENENGENITFKVKEKKRKNDSKLRPYKHKGPRIGRPPVLGKFPCKYCDFVTYEKNLVDKHYNEVHKKEWMKCEYCDYSTRSKNCLLEHEARNHTNSKPFKCEHEGCQYASNVRNDYNKHISQAHTLDKPYKCTKCDYETRWRRNLRNHLNLRHSDVRKFTCAICNHAFKRKTDLKSHMDRHSDEKPLQCDTCGFRCKTNWEMKSHRLKHTDIRNFPCTFPGCTQACKTKSDLTKHMVRHKTVKDFKCELCPNSYKCSSSLKKHIQYQHNNNIRNFHCDTCGKAFKVKAALRKHMIVHSDSRPFYCDICGSGHTSKNNMDKHKLTHRLNELPYHCPICPFGTKLPNALLAHIGSAHGDSYAYYCEICRKPFKRYSQLRLHYSRMHSEQDYKNLGNPTEIDLALMKMQMSLDLDDTFESVGVSSKKKEGSVTIKQEPFDTDFHNLEEDMSSDSDLPGDEEFEAMERELNNETELPHDIRKLKEAKTKKSKAADEGNVKKKRGRPKKIIPVETEEHIETLITQESIELPDDVINNDLRNSLSAEQEATTEVSTRKAEGINKQTPGETLELNVTAKESSNTHSIITATEMDKNSANAADPSANSNEEQETETSTPSVITATETGKNIGNTAEPIVNSIQTKGQESEIPTTETGSKGESNLLTGNKDLLGQSAAASQINNQEKAPSSNLFDTVLSSDTSGSKSVEPSDNPINEREAETASLLSHYCKTTNQREETDSNNKQNETDDNEIQCDTLRQQDIEQRSSTEPESTNIPDPFFFNKTENQFQATIALYDGFRLPLATKGFAFNYDKMGTKPKSWFMDPANMMDHRARQRQINFVRLQQVKAKLERRARPVYKDGKKPGRAVGSTMSRSYNYKNAHMVKYIAEKRKQGLAWNRITKQWVKKGEEDKCTNEELRRAKIKAARVLKTRINRSLIKRNFAEFENVTSEEFKQTEETKILKKRRKRSFKGNYAEFENMDGDNLTVNEVRDLLPSTSKAEKEAPKKKRKIVDTNKETNVVKETVDKKAKTVNKKVKKKIAKRKQTADKTKPVLLYSERKKPTKAMRIRKPGFLNETNENDGQGDIQNNSDQADLLNVPVAPPQKRKPGRKPKDLTEKKSNKKTKAPIEPVQPKFKYVKRAKQKKPVNENEDNGNTVSGSVQGTKRKQTTEKPAVKKSKTNSGKKMQVKFTRNPKQTSVNTNNQLHVSSQRMLHETVAGSNLVRVHLPQNVNEISGIPGLMTGQIPGVDMRQVMQGGKCLMYCDDVVVMKDLNSSQEIFGLGINQIKTETFIEPVEPFSENQVFNTGAIINSVHPVLLTQNPVAPSQHSIPVPTGITGPHIVNNVDDNVIDDRIAMLREGGREGVGTGGNDEVLVTVNASVDTNGEMVTQQAGTLMIREASTDKEVMQLDYSIVKNEPSDE